MKWLKKKRIWLLAFILLLACAFPVGCHYRLKWQVDAYVRGLRVSGEPLKLSELAPVPAYASLKASDDFLRAAGSLRGQAVMELEFRPGPPTAGVETVVWREEARTSSPPAVTWTSVAECIRTNHEALLTIERILQKQDLVFDLDYGLGYELLFPYTEDVKTAARWLRMKVLVELRSGDSAEAFKTLQALVALVRRYGNEPGQVTEWTRCALNRMAISATWQALQSPGCTEPQLRELQTAWEAVEPLKGTEQTLRMERLFLRKAIQDGRAKNIFRARYGSPPPFFKKPLVSASYLLDRELGYFVWRFWQSYEDELANSVVFQTGIEAARKCRRDGCFEPAIREVSAAREYQYRTYPRCGGWSGLRMAEVPMRCLEEAAVLSAYRTLVIAAIALERYHLARGMYPESLDSLCPEFLHGRALDPMDGRELRYQLQRERYRLYSVGLDGVDNRGRPGVFLRRYQYFGDRGTDLVWPRPATEEELEKFRRQRENEAVAKWSPFDEAARRRFMARYGLQVPKPSNVSTNQNSP